MTSGRTQKKFVETITLDAERKFISHLPRDLYCAGVSLTFRGRIRVTVLATTLLPEGIFNLVKRLRVNINHKDFKAQTLLDMYGPTLAAYRAIYNGIAPFSFVDPPLGVGVADMDFMFKLGIQLTPENIFASDQSFYELDAPNCSLFDLEIDFGNAEDVIEGGTTSLTAFGLNTGNPAVDISLWQVLDRENLPARNLVKRIEAGDAFETTIGGTGALNIGRVIPSEDFPLGETIRALLLRQYTRTTVAGQPLDAAATLLDPSESGVDAGLGAVALRVNERPVQHWASWQELRSDNEEQYRVQPIPLGYASIDFVKIGNLVQSLVTADFPDRKLRVDLAGAHVGAANRRINRIFTTLLANPRIVASAV